MRHEVKYQPSYALAFIDLDPGESIQAEAGAMVSMSSAIEMETSTRGGLLSGLRRSVLGGESFFINTFRAEHEAGQVTVAPALPGDIIALELTGQTTLLVQSGSFLAATEGVDVDTKWGGAKSFFSSEGLFLLRCTGQGTIWLSSYGAIHPIDLGVGEPYTVDTGHMVAFDDSVQYDVGRSGGWKSTLFSGEGLVVKLTGPGRFFMQTRSEDSFLSWLIPKLPKQSSN
ncbi:MAG: TIGR00266 family protein [Chloroflexi bacterium]|nr:TIGR00266 family protein [Chloroflexota bacterium]